MLYNKSMVQDQLVEYISSQLKLGVSRDAIRAALVAAGWATADIDDTLKQVESENDAKQAPAVPLGSGSPGVGSSSGGTETDPAAAKASAEPKTIRVSDLISAGPATPAPPSVPKRPDGNVAGGDGKGKNTLLSLGAKAKEAKEPPAETVKEGKKAGWGGRIMLIAGIILIVALGGLAGYLYFQNNGLATKISSLSNVSASVSTKIATLNGNITALNASNTALTAQVQSLTTENSDLMENLSFVALPPASSTGTSTPAAASVSVSGTLAKNKTSYVLTTQYGVQVYIKNSADKAVAAALAPLAGGTSTVTLAGTHVPGSAYLTVTSVNGSAVQ